jgi:predicted kinase
LGVRALLLVCEAEPEVVRERLVSRRGGASDAGVAVHERMAERWEEPGAATRAALRAVPTGAGPGAALDRALAHLAAHGLAPAP